MRKYLKTIFLLFVAAVLMIGVPYVKTPGSCGLILPLAFTGAILGCGGEKEPAMQPDTTQRSMAFASENDSNRDSKNESKKEHKVTFVELGSENCMPCRMMKPVLARVSKEYPGQVRVVYHDVMTESGRLEGSKYRIRVIPTQIFLDSTGKEYFRHEGFFSFEDIDRVLKQKSVN